MCEFVCLSVRLWILHLLRCWRIKKSDKIYSTASKCWEIYSPLRCEIFPGVCTEAMHGINHSKLEKIRQNCVALDLSINVKILKFLLILDVFVEIKFLIRNWRVLKFIFDHQLPTTKKTRLCIGMKVLLQSDQILMTPPLLPGKVSYSYGVADSSAFQAVSKKAFK